MDVDSSSSSPSERLSVVCSASAEYSSNSSEHSPNSRRNSVNESVVKDEQYWERRRKNNDASKRSREKRRIGDMAMEQRILALSQENHLLKSRLESRTAAESLLQTARPDFASLPPQSNTVCLDLLFFIIYLFTSRQKFAIVEPPGYLYRIVERCKIRTVWSSSRYCG
ncbi:unnamed protein product [Nippostrongylus brasiliensis]|uniref:BZIP domain-containing protein n=1 Tax=Nippostrongylus brasiliensis TaxID=27835 RepID=A0A0N4XPP7_NIPBR|nr:unnamed protein product [Nippostrongylus brasiliensis]